jgi:GTPase
LKDIPTARVKERVVLIGLISQEQDERHAKEYLDELAFLVETAGGISIHRFMQRLAMPDSRTFIGSGKLEEVQNYVAEHKIDLVVFDDELSPSQLRNIEKSLNCRILDRNNLILDIFATRARTAHARVQVELAQHQYMLPRLTRMWTHLEKQQGGIGTRGPGEKEIETDRRIIKEKIALLKEKLEKIDRQKSTQRQNRGKLVRVALVGYTNVGKSTLMNLMSKSEVFAEDKLFATLDTTVRKVIIANVPFLLSDTVGFIRKLPHSLVESFKSTLDEVRESDILLHLVDISHPAFEEQIAIVNQTLAELGSLDKPTLVVFNKIDKYREDNPDNTLLEDFRNSWMASANAPALFISARSKENMEELRETLYEEVKRIHVQRFPFNDFLF